MTADAGTPDAQAAFEAAPDTTALDRARKAMLKLRTYGPTMGQHLPALTALAATEAQIAQAEALQTIAHELITINDRQDTK